MNVGDWLCRHCGTINATTSNRCIACERERGTPTLVDKTAMLITVVLGLAILAAVAAGLGMIS